MHGSLTDLPTRTVHDQGLVPQLHEQQVLANQVVAELLVVAPVLKKTGQPTIVAQQGHVEIFQRRTDMVFQLVEINRPGNRQQTGQQPNIFYGAKTMVCDKCAKFDLVQGKHR